MIPKLNVVIDDNRWALLQVDKNQPGAGSFIDANAETGLIDVSALQKSIEGLQAVKAKVCLGISHRDLIVRAFVLPEMPTAELNKAIIFEVKKYIPFSITEAYYSTLTFPFVENNNKMIRVLFYATRKINIEKYKDQLAQAGLLVTRCEPAICGLVRTMIFRKDIHPADRFALLDIRQEKGIIYFIDGGVVKFVREIPLTVVVNPINEQAADQEALQARFFNEIHNSFDFYYRQLGERATEMLVVSSDEWFGSLQTFMTSVNIKCRKYSFEFVSGVRMVTEFPMSCAFGLGLSGNMFVPPIDFLVPHKVVKQSIINTLNLDVKEFIPALRLAVVIIVLLTALAGFLWFQEQELKKQLALDVNKQGEFTSLSVNDIQSRISKTQKDIKGFGQAPSESYQHVILLLIAQHIPQGMWLQDVNLVYNYESKVVTISIKAAMYTPNVALQARAINTFVSDLKNDKALARYVPKWQLKTMTRQQMKNVMITIFDLSNG